MTAEDGERTAPGGWTAGRIMALEYVLVALGIVIALTAAASALSVDVSPHGGHPDGGHGAMGPGTLPLQHHHQPR